MSDGEQSGNPAPSPEQLLAAQGQQEQLRQHRAEVMVGGSLRYGETLARHAKFDAEEWLFLTPDRLDSAAEYGTTDVDSVLVAAKTRLGLEAVGHASGLEDGAVFEKIRRQAEGTDLLFPIGPGLSFQVNKPDHWGRIIGQRIIVDEGVTLEERKHSLRAFVDKVAERSRPFNAAMDQLIAGLSGGETEVFAEQTFTFRKDAKQLISFLQGSSIRGIQNTNSFDQNMFQASELAQDQTAIERLYANLAPRYSRPEDIEGDKSGVYFTADGCVEQVLMPTEHEGLYLAIRNTDVTESGDIDELELQLGVVVDAKNSYTEVSYNGVKSDTFQPLIETETAREVLQAFDAQGLTLNAKLRDYFAEVGQIEKLYGHGYSEITRELAKLVNDPSRSLSNFFDGDDEAEWHKAIRKLDTPEDPAARVIVDLLKGIVDRQTGPAASGVVELAASTQKIEIRNGGCKDAEVYVINGQPAANGEQAPIFWNSSYNRRSVVTLQPMRLNGVTLPAGALLAVEDDGYLFMRMTSFAFSEDEALQAFGAQEYENSRWGGTNDPGYYAARSNAIRHSMHAAA